MEHDFKKIEEWSKIVKNDIRTRFPNCNYTIKILLWDDGTSSITCCHGDEEKIYNSIYYNGELTFEEHVYLSSRIKMNAEGKEYYAINDEND